MSLINRMLQDLSMRQPATADLRAGLHFAVLPPRAGETGSRLEAGLLLVLVAVFTSILWWLFATQQPQLAASAAAASPRWTYFRLEPQLDLGRLTQAAPMHAALSLMAQPRELRLDAALQRKPSRRLRDLPAEPRVEQAGGDAAAVIEATGSPPLADMAAVEARVDSFSSAEPPIVDAVVTDPLRDARLDLARGEPQAALDKLRRVPARLATNPEYQGLLAAAYQRLGQHEHAAAGYQGLISLQPEQSHWWAGYGISLDALQQREAALNAFQRALALGGLDARVQSYIAVRSVELREERG